MSYNKTTWVNNQTKLSATNMNHLETGVQQAHELAEQAIAAIDTVTATATVANQIASNANIRANTALDTAQQALTKAESASTANHSHENKEILDQITEPFTSELKSSFEGKSVVSVNSEGEATERVQYITINGREYKLAGEGLPNYQELTSVNLDSLLTTGTYKITAANDAPAKTSSNGVLRVTALQDDKIAQEWQSNTNYATRILDNAASTLHFYVNDIEQPQGNVVLASGGSYRLRGELAGQVIISGSATKYTSLYLEGVTINSVKESAIIQEADTKLSVELVGAFENYLLVNDKETIEDSSSIGALHCEGDLSIYGTGYLSIVSVLGHDIKAADIYIGGKPKIYIDAHHDGIHGKTLKVTDGNIYIKNANDAFSAGSNNNDGKIYISGGKLEIEACRENAFQAKKASTGLAGKIRVYGDSIIILHSSFTTSSVFSAENGTPFILETASITAPLGVVLPEITTLATYYGDVPHVLTAAGTEVAPENNTFTLATDDATYELYGNFTGYKVIASGKKVNLKLANVYCNTETLSEDAFIDYTYGSKRLEFKLADDSINIIHKNGGYAIKSNKNIVINNENDFGDIFIECPNGYGIYADADVRIVNDGARYIQNCNVGVHANYLSIGEDWEDIDNSKKKMSYVYILNNTTDVELFSRTGSTGDWIVGKILAPQNNYGFTLIGNISNLNSEDDASVEATEGAVAPEGETFTRHSVIYILEENEIIVSTYVVRYFEADLGGNPKEAHIDDTIVINSWTVYAGNGYSKEEVNEQFVSKDTYNTLLRDLDARAPKRIQIINYVPDSSQDDGRPAKKAAYANGQVDGIDIFRYACPEQIDIDSTVDKEGNKVDEPETHLSYVKDGRTIYARDGDFGYPEIDSTGQFNFRPTKAVKVGKDDVYFPLYAKTGLVLVPVVTDFSGKPHDSNEKITVDGVKVLNPDYNPCYKNFKTPWLTGMEDVYRFTKVCKDIKVDIQAVAESSFECNSVRYELVVPADYDGGLPTVRIFRCSDQVEKYFKYYLDENRATKYPALSDAYISGEQLEFGEFTTTGEIKSTFIDDVSYSDDTGYPAKDAARVTFLVDDSAVTEGYSVVVSATPKANYGNLNPGDFGPTKTISKINDDITVTITVAPPVDIEYDDQTNKITYINKKGNTKLAYGIRLDPEDTEEEKNAPSSGAQGAPFNFKLTFDGEGTYLGYVEDKDPVTKAIIAVYTDDSKTTQVTSADILPYIASITIGSTVYSTAEQLATVFEGISLEAAKATFTVKGELVTDDIVIALAPRPVRE